MKNRIIDAYDSVTPIRSDDEIIANAIGKARIMEKRTIKIKKPLVAACAAVTALGLGITAAAVTGIIDFNALFGGRIGAYNENVNDGLLADVTNISVNSGNDEYTLKMGGVIGTGGYLAGSLELVRTDGAPVADYMYDIDTSKRFDSGEWWTTLYDENGENVEFVNGDGMEHYLGFTLNEAGNINCNFHFLPFEDMPDAGTAEITFTANWIKTEDNRPFTMSAKFDYTPAETAQQSKEIVTDGKTVTLDDGSQAEVLYSRFNCLSGVFQLEYPIGSTDFGLDAPVALILADGGEMPIELCSMTSYDYLGKGTTAETFRFVYSSELDGNITAININDIVAVSLNGTVFDLV